MKIRLLKTIVALFLAGFGLAHAADVGEPAPAFANKNVKGEEVSLDSLKGKVVVLEWVNFDCPFVKKHYSSGNMPALQKKYTGQGVVWLTINSSASGKQGFLEASALAERATKDGNAASQVLLDSDGKTGQAYGAKVTPHMFIIGTDGKLLYDGAIDSKPTTDAKDIESAEKLFANALDAVLAGKPVANAKNKPYGCGVKY